MVGAVNAMFVYSTFFSRSDGDGLPSDGEQIMDLLHDPENFFKEGSRPYQITMAYAFILRRDADAGIDFITNCEKYSESAELCELLGLAYSLNYQFEKLLYWSSQSLKLIEKTLDSEDSGAVWLRFRIANAKNNIAFAMLCLNSADKETMFEYSSYALTQMPWVENVIGTYASIQIRCGDVGKGLAMLEISRLRIRL
jgi:hypothetical protein